MADKPYKSKRTVKKEVQLDKPVKKDTGEIQVHFGNYKKIELALLNAINKNLYELLKEIRSVKERIDKESK